MMSKSRSGQITLFIIFGVLILLIAGGAIVAVRSFSKPNAGDHGTSSVSTAELSPAESFVTQCLANSGERVLVNIGEHGGYYNPQDSNAFTAIPEQPTRGNAFMPFADRKGMILPYWRYLKSPEDSTSPVVASLKPPLEGTRFPAIEWQAERATEQEFARCIDNFKSLDSRIEAHNTSDPQVHVTFSEQETVFSLDYAVSVTTAAGAPASFHQYSTTVPVPFKHVYNFASNIMNTEDSVHHFEGLTMNVISLNSGSDAKHLPPPYGGSDTTYALGPFWTKQATISKLASALQADVTPVQVLASAGSRLLSTGDRATDNQYALLNMAVPNTPPDVSARFTYTSSWKPWIAIRPGDGELITPKFVSVGGLPFFPNLRIMDFQYDVVYPVLVVLHQDTPHGGFTFQFPFQVMVKNNNPLETQDYAQQTNDDSLCAPSALTGATVDLSVQNDGGETQASFSCVQAYCPLGTVQNGELKTPLLPCLGGQVTLERPGYRKAQIPVDTLSAANPITQAVTLTKLTTVTVNIAGLSTEKDTTGTWGPTANPVTLDDTYTTILSFTSVEDPSQTTVVSIPSDVQTVDLAPGEYSVSAFSLKEITAPIVLASETLCKGSALLGTKHCAVIPDITLGETQVDANGNPVLSPDGKPLPSQILAGGMRWDISTHTVSFTQQQLDSGTLTIPVQVIKLDQMTKARDINVLSKLDDFSKQIAQDGQVVPPGTTVPSPDDVYPDTSAQTPPPASNP